MTRRRPHWLAALDKRARCKFFDVTRKRGSRADMLILALKGNQGTLLEDVELFANEQKTNGFKNAKISRHKTVDGDHGRIETRTTPVL
jgi:hypothetical protein